MRRSSGRRSSVAGKWSSRGRPSVAWASRASPSTWLRIRYWRSAGRLACCPATSSASRRGQVCSARASWRAVTRGRSSSIAATVAAGGDRPSIARRAGTRRCSSVRWPISADPGRRAGSGLRAPAGRAETSGVAPYDPLRDVRRPGAATARRRPRRPRRGRWIVLAVVVVVARRGPRSPSTRWSRPANTPSRGSTGSGRRSASSIPAELIRGKGLGKLRAAQQDFAAASDAADSAVRHAVRGRPGRGAAGAVRCGRSRAARRRSSTSASARWSSRRRSSTSPRPQGAERIALLSRLGEIGAAGGRLAARRRPRPRRRADRSARLGADKFAAPAAQGAARDGRRARRVGQGIGQMALGPSKYLLLAANNAEMRSGSGMLLSAGCPHDARAATSRSGR